MENKYKYGTIKEKTNDKQKQSLHYTYEILYHLLYIAENYAGIKNGQYKASNIFISTKYKDLKSEFAWELHCFQLAKKKYEKIYGKYVFPNNLSKEKILFDINKYIQNLSNEKDKVLYYAMIIIIIGEKIDINFDELFKELDRTPNKILQPRELEINYLNQTPYTTERNNKEEKNKYEIRKYKSSSLGNVMKSSNKENNFLLGIIGKKGILTKVKEPNIFSIEFKNDCSFDKDYKLITFDNPILKGKKLYKCKIKNKYTFDKNGFIYFLSDNFNYRGSFCILFDEDPKNIPEQYIKIIDEKNGYGAYKMNDYIEGEDFLIIGNYKNLKKNNYIINKKSYNIYCY